MNNQALSEMFCTTFKEGEEIKIMCMNYMFDNKICIEDELPCGVPCGSDESPDSIDQCRNKKYKPLLLPKGYSELVMKELRGY